MPALEHSAEDERTVRTQLGRPARGRWGVAARCHLGLPVVIENHPVLEDGSPFPTTYWLTCPLLVKRVSRLEAGGRMRELNAALSADQALASRMSDAIERYVARRDEHEVIADSEGPPGGDAGRIKCLHAHAAHELAGGSNPAGAIALAETGWPDCRLPCVAGAGVPEWMRKKTT